MTNHWFWNFVRCGVLGDRSVTVVFGGAYVFISGSDVRLGLMPCFVGLCSLSVGRPGMIFRGRALLIVSFGKGDCWRHGVGDCQDKGFLSRRSCDG